MELSWPGVYIQVQHVSSFCLIRQQKVILKKMIWERLTTFHFTNILILHRQVLESWTLRYNAASIYGNLGFNTVMSYLGAVEKIIKDLDSKSSFKKFMLKISRYGWFLEKLFASSSRSSFCKFSYNVYSFWWCIRQ